MSKYKLEKRLAEVEAKRSDLQETLLRISGAIMVLEEELAKEGESSSADDGHAAS